MARSEIYFCAFARIENANPLPARWMAGRDQRHNFMNGFMFDFERLHVDHDSENERGRQPRPRASAPYTRAMLRGEIRRKYISKHNWLRTMRLA